MPLRNDRETDRNEELVNRAADISKDVCDKLNLSGHPSRRVIVFQTVLNQLAYGGLNQLAYGGQGDPDQEQLRSAHPQGLLTTSEEDN